MTWEEIEAKYGIRKPTHSWQSRKLYAQLMSIPEDCRMTFVNLRMRGRISRIKKCQVNRERVPIFVLSRQERALTTADWMERFARSDWCGIHKYPERDLVYLPAEHAAPARLREPPSYGKTALLVAQAMRIWELRRGIGLERSA